MDFIVSGLLNIALKGTRLKEDIFCKPFLSQMYFSIYFFLPYFTATMHAMGAPKMDRDGVTMKEALEVEHASIGEMDLPIFILKKFTL